MRPKAVDGPDEGLAGVTGSRGDGETMSLGLVWGADGVGPRC